MSLRAFLYATEVLRLQHTDSVETPEAPADLPARNAESMKTLMAMMGGVQGGPVMKR